MQWSSMPHVAPLKSRVRVCLMHTWPASLLDHSGTHAVVFNAACGSTEKQSQSLFDAYMACLIIGSFKAVWKEKA